MKKLLLLILLVSACENPAANITVNTYGCIGTRTGNTIEIECPAGGSVTIKLP